MATPTPWVSETATITMKPRNPPIWGTSEVTAAETARNGVRGSPRRGADRDPHAVEQREEEVADEVAGDVGVGDPPELVGPGQVLGGDRPRLRSRAAVRRGRGRR